jgi:hypothetical protein
MGQGTFAKYNISVSGAAFQRQKNECVYAVKVFLKTVKVLFVHPIIKEYINKVPLAPRHLP